MVCGYWVLVLVAVPEPVPAPETFVAPVPDALVVPVVSPGAAPAGGVAPAAAVPHWMLLAVILPSEFVVPLTRTSSRR